MTNREYLNVTCLADAAESLKTIWQKVRKAKYQIIEKAMVEYYGAQYFEKHWQNDFKMKLKRRGWKANGNVLNLTIVPL